MLPATFPHRGVGVQAAELSQLVTMQLPQQGSRLVLALALLLVLDSPVQGKTQESCPSIIFASPGVHTNDYIHLKVQNVLYCGKGGKEKGFGGELNSST